MYGLDLRLDAVLEERVREVWWALEAKGFRSLASSGHARHQPHMSLAVGPRLCDVDPDAFAGLRPPRSVTLVSAATFGVEGGVVFLAVRPSPDLYEFHRAVVAALGLAAHGMSGYYHPGRLTPHVTVAEGLLTASLGRALQTVVPHLPLTGSYTALEIVDACTGVRRRVADY
jgi:hypothetical protein